jgi:hypothetical protein
MKMEDKNYIGRLESSLANLIKEEGFRDIKSSEGYDQERMLYRFGDKSSCNVKNDSAPKEKRAIYELVNERLESSEDKDMYEQEARFLWRESEASINFAARNKSAKRYQEAARLGQRAIEDCMTAMKYAPEVGQYMAGSLNLAEQITREAIICWRNPETGYLMIELERLVSKEDYVGAANIQKKIDKKRKELEK